MKCGECGTDFAILETEAYEAAQILCSLKDLFLTTTAEERTIGGEGMANLLDRLASQLFDKACLAKEGGDHGG